MKRILGVLLICALLFLLAVPGFSYGRLNNYTFLSVGTGGFQTQGGALAVKTVGGISEFTVDINGNVTAQGTLSVAGAQTFTGALGLAGNFSVNTSKFTVAAATGNTVVAGTLGVGGVTFTSANMVQSQRISTTIANVNSGTTLLPAVPGKSYRVSGIKIIAVGGTATSTNATGIAISGTQSTSAVALFTVAKAGLVRSTINTDSSANTTVLADGASFEPCDAGTALTIASVGGTDMATATNIKVIITYTLQ